MPEYKKIGYLHTKFKIFHLTDASLDVHFHYHDYHKILILLKGDVTYCIEGRSYELLPNDIVFVPAGEVHKPIVHSKGKYERFIMYISDEIITPSADLFYCFKQAKYNQSHVLRLQNFHQSRLEKSMKELIASISDVSYAHELYQESLFYAFLIQLNRAMLNRNLTFIENTAENEKILSVLDYINENLTEDLSVEVLSNQFFISRYYLMHTFKEQTGYTIGNYISTKRLLLAKDKLSTNEPITNICYECGFRNYSTFSRAYKKCFGESPKDTRQST